MGRRHGEGPHFLWEPRFWLPDLGEGGLSGRGRDWLQWVSDVCLLLRTHTINLAAAWAWGKMERLGTAQVTIPITESSASPGQPPLAEGQRPQQLGQLGGLRGEKWEPRWV